MADGCWPLKFRDASSKGTASRFVCRMGVGRASEGYDLAFRERGPLFSTMDELDRMYRRLVQNVRTSFPDLLGRPFEVSELYTALIPYRLNKREMGLDTNQDYEHAL